MPRRDDDFREQTHHCTWVPFQSLAKENNEYEKQSWRVKSCSLIEGIPVFETPCQAPNNVTSGQGTNYTIWINNTKTAWHSRDYLRFLTSHEPPHASGIPITLTKTQGKRCWNKKNYYLLPPRSDYWLLDDRHHVQRLLKWQPTLLDQWKQTERQTKNNTKSLVS